MGSRYGGNYVVREPLQLACKAPAGVYSQPSTSPLETPMLWD